MQGAAIGRAIDIKKCWCAYDILKRGRRPGQFNWKNFDLHADRPQTIVLIVSFFAHLRSFVRKEMRITFYNSLNRAVPLTLVGEQKKQQQIRTKWNVKNKI